MLEIWTERNLTWAAVRYFARIILLWLKHWRIEAALHQKHILIGFVWKLRAHTPHYWEKMRREEKLNNIIITPCTLMLYVHVNTSMFDVIVQTTIKSPFHTTHFDLTCLVCTVHARLFIFDWASCKFVAPTVGFRCENDANPFRQSSNYVCRTSLIIV